MRSCYYYYYYCYFSCTYSRRMLTLASVSGPSAAQASPSDRVVWMSNEGTWAQVPPVARSWAMLAPTRTCRY